MAVITVTTGKLDWYAGDETVTMRLCANKTFVDAEGETVVCGSGSQGFYIEVPTTPTAPDNHLQFDEFAIGSTTNGTPTDGSFRIELWGNVSGKLKTVYKHLKIPPSPTTTTLAALIIYSESN